MRARKSEAPFADRIASVWGGLHEIVQTADNPDEALADFFQVTPAQLRAWRAAEGRHRCPETTTRGRACRNQASTVIDYDPRVWVARQPSYCPAHLPSRGPSAPPGSGPRVVGAQAADAIAASEDDGWAPAR